MLLRFVLAACFMLGTLTPAGAQDSTEPPPPKAAPRTSVMSEELPRAGAIVVFGADDPLGFEIAKALAAANKQVIAAVPAGADTKAFEALKIGVVTVDPTAPDSLKEMFASAPLRAVVAAYDTTGERPAFGVDGTRAIIDATKATGVPRFVLVSATGTGDSAGVLPWYIRFLRGDAIAAAVVAEDHLKTAGIDYTIVRAGWITPDETSPTAALSDAAPEFTWIAHVDLAKLVAATVDTRALSGKTATAVDPARASLFSVIF